MHVKLFIFKLQLVWLMDTCRLVPMGCYGIGVSRLLATLVEVGHKDGCLSWPQVVAPYLFCIVSSCKVCCCSDYFI